MTTMQPKPTTTDAGIAVDNDKYSLTVGPGGPILLQAGQPQTDDTARRS